MKITPEILEQYQVTNEEYENICEILGREPNLIELGIFSVMWSEQCSYKSSKIHLERLPTEGEWLVQGPGENAGIVEIGNGWCAVFRIESHNYLARIDPCQGAATGIGGTLRDIFTMGARPVAVMNSLRFGPITDPATSSAASATLLENVSLTRKTMIEAVRGLSGYSNAFGVPTIGGEISFDHCYIHHPLVNVFALGLVRQEHIFYGKAEGVGNSIIYAGAKTGRDGVGTAISQSQLSDSGGPGTPARLQVGDPFTGKLLLEACLEAMRERAIIGIQDLGIGGLTSASCEMGARAGTGIEINLNLVPQREAGMTACDIMLSESQERMIMVAEKGHERQVLEIFARWDLDAVTIGRVTADQTLRLIDRGETLAEVPTLSLTKEAPLYQRPIALQQVDNQDVSADVLAAIGKVESPTATYGGILHRLMATPTLASKDWVSRQYDHTVRTNTVVPPGSDAAVIRVKETRHSLSMSLDGNGRYSRLNPREGARLAVVESARNVVCSGARPLAVTNCLNFAKPENPAVMWAFSETIDGMAEACRQLNTPITGGNVSFDNGSEGQSIDPTPVIGMLGLVEEYRHVTTQWFKEEGDIILLLGLTGSDLGASELLWNLTGEVKGAVPQLNLKLELAVQEACLRAIRQGFIRSAHDCSEGGLAVALAESCFASYRQPSTGALIDLREHAALGGISEPAALLFAESPSRIIISVKPDDVDSVCAIARETGAPCSIIGRVFTGRLQIECGQALIDEEIEDLERTWKNSLNRYLDLPLWAESPTANG